MARAEERGIYQRGNAFVVDVMVKGQRATETCATYDMALIRRDELRAQLRRTAEHLDGPAAVSSCWTLHKALRTSIQVRWDDTRNGAKAIRHATKAVEFFGKETRLDQVTTSEIDRYVGHLKASGNGSGTINRKLAALSALFTDAMHRDGCNRKPRMPRQAEPTHRIRYLSAAEESMACSLLTQWGHVAEREVVTVLIDTGMRVGELMALRINDVDLGANLISVWENKGDLPRSIPMTDRVRSIVGDRCITRNGLVFGDVKRYVLEAAWAKARAEMGLAEDKQFVLHALRHTCATRLVQRGVSLYVVQKLLGHSSIAITEKYAHLSDRELAEAINVLQQPTTNEHGVLRTAGGEPATIN